jgi:hypothetical protein
MIKLQRTAGFFASPFTTVSTINSLHHPIWSLAFLNAVTGHHNIQPSAEGSVMTEDTVAFECMHMFNVCTIPG